MLSATERQTRNWINWIHTVSVILEEIVPFDFNGSIQARLLYSCRVYGYIGGWRLLAESELPENGKEGFRLQYCRSKQYIDVVRRKDGSLYVRSTVKNYEFEASTTKPSEHLIKQFEAVLDFLLMFGDFGTDF